MLQSSSFTNKKSSPSFVKTWNVARDLCSSCNVFGSAGWRDRRALYRLWRKFTRSEASNHCNEVLSNSRQISFWGCSLGSSTAFLLTALLILCFVKTSAANGSWLWSFMYSSLITVPLQSVFTKALHFLSVHVHRCTSFASSFWKQYLNAFNTSNFFPFSLNTNFQMLISWLQCDDTYTKLKHLCMLHLLPISVCVHSCTNYTTNWS